jgi:hypothetical protein
LGSFRGFVLDAPHVFFAASIAQEPVSAGSDHYDQNQSEQCFHRQNLGAAFYG